MPAITHMLRYIKHHTKLGLLYYSSLPKSPAYEIFQENNIVPTRHILTFSNSRWDDENDISRNTGGFRIFYEGAVKDHSGNIPESIADISAKE
jgi:hypothetical protein